MEELVAQYGLEVSLTCLVSIFLVGCFKLIFKKQLEKVEQTSRKTIYEVASIVMSFGLTALWLFLKGKFFGGPGFEWEMLGKEGALIYSCTKVTYALYENFKLRDLFQIIGKSVVGLFTKKKEKVEQKKEDEDSTNKVNVI